MYSIKNSKPTSILQTDFYQLTMAYAYLHTDKAEEATGFESFVRKIKPEISNENYYYFNGEEEIREFIYSVKKEIREPDFFDRFWEMIKDKVDQSTYKKTKKKFKKIYKFFDFTVMSNGDKVHSFVPVFQYYGPRFFGQLLETPITNIINGRVGYQSAAMSSKKNKGKSLYDIYHEEDKVYMRKLRTRAKEYRNATSKILLEAGYRRAPSFEVATNASRIAIEENWDSTSNTTIFEDIDSSLINGSMAHAYVMSFEKDGKPNELEAFRSWNELFPNSTILIDTYNVENAIDILIQNEIKPKAVRIDSDPIEDYVRIVRKKLNKAGWSDVQIFISGDITPEKLIKWEEENLPFDICMAGTHYVNIDTAKNINPGFVYKIVEFTNIDTGFTEYPEKKSTGKSNYPGLKAVYFDKNRNELIVSIKEKSFGFSSSRFSSFKDIDSDTKVIFKERGIEC